MRHPATLQPASAALPRGARSGLRAALLPAVDLAALAAAFALAGAFKFSLDHAGAAWAASLAALALGCLVAFQQLGHYARRRELWQEVGDVAAVALVGFLFHAAALYLLKVGFSRAWVAAGWALVPVLVPAARVAARRALAKAGGWRRPVVIVGAGALAREAAAVYAEDPSLGYDVVAFVDPWPLPASLPGQGGGERPEALAIGGREAPVVELPPGDAALPAWLGRPRVVVALDLDELAGREGLIERLSLRHADLEVISPVRGLPIGGARVAHFFSHDVLSLRLSNNLAKPWSQALKRGFDVLGAGALLVFLAPLMLAVWAMVRAQGGAAVFSHTRVGRDGRLFKCLKFRSMVPNADEVLSRLLATDAQARAEWAKDYKLKDDPRVTPLGDFLRKTSLDELPQLVNVLKGEMSLVGPRPVVPAELERYGEAQAYYLEVRPGLTGLWQISGRNDVDYARRVSLDTWYVRNWTLWYDVVILFKTALAVPGKKGAY